MRFQRDQYSGNRTIEQCRLARRRKKSAEVGLGDAIDRT